MAAGAANRNRVSQIAKIERDDRTDQITALQTALALKLAVIIFLTDIDRIANGNVEEILAEIRKTPKQGVGRGLLAAFRSEIDSFRRPTEKQQPRTHVIQFGHRPKVDPPTSLRAVANRRRRSTSSSK